MLSVDEVTKKIKEFQNMHRDKNYHFHNTYYMYTEDMDGNITGEAYGINFMTNYGFNRLCANENCYRINQNSVYVTNFNRIVGRPIFGTGTGPLTFNEPASEIPTMQEFFAMPAYNMPNGKDNEVPVISTEYDPVKKIIYETDYLGNGVLDYNISGVTTDTNITEVGIGYDASHLYFHFLIRNKNGDIAPIVKRPNEKLTIYVYATFCVHENIMLNGLSRNEYILTNPTAFSNAMAYYDDYKQSYDGYDTVGLMSDRVYCYRYDTYDYSYSYQTTHLTSDSRSVRNCLSNNTIYTNNECEYNVKMTNSILLENKEAYIGLTLYNGTRQAYHNNYSPFRRDATGWADMFIFKFDKQTTSEEIICEDIYTNTSLTNGRINQQYGRKRDTSNKIGAISAVDYKIQSMKMFNVQDNDFTIDETFSQNDNYQSFYQFHARCPYYNFVCPDGIKRTIYASVNPWTSMKIQKFTNTGITIFAADKAWDYTTWTQIPNIAAVPDELSHSRYYVSYSNVCLTYEFKDQYYPKIIPKTQVVEYDADYDHDLYNQSTDDHDSTSNSGHSGYIVGTDEYNWFALGRTIFIMNDDNTINTKYNIHMHQNTDMLNRFAYKNLYFITNGRDSDTSIPILCRINNDHTVDEIRLPRAFNRSCVCYYSDTGISKNGRFLACWTNKSSGTLVYDMELLKNIQSETTVLANYSKENDQQAILDDFTQGSYNINDGRSISPSSWENDYWISLNKFIEFPNIVDNKSIWFNITADATSNCSKPKLWARVYFYDENETYLGYRYYQTYGVTITTVTGEIPYTNAKKIKISLHQGDTTSNMLLYVNWLKSLKISYGISDLPPEGAITLIPNACNSFCMKNRNILVYTKGNDEYIKSWYIQDLEHMDVEPQKISIEDGQYGNTVTSGMGFFNYIYIRLNDQQNIYSTWMYDLGRNEWTHLVDLNLDFNTGTVCGDERCILWTPGDNARYKYIITADEPKVWRTFSEAKWDTTIMKYINNGKQLVISSNHDRVHISGSSTSDWYTGPRTYDLGLWLRDKKWVNGEPRLRYETSFNTSSCYRAYNYPYKNGVITLKPLTDSRTSFKLYYYPIEYYLPHKTVGTTRTITAYNNPIRITGKGYKFTRTNDMSKLGLENN